MWSNCVLGSFFRYFGSYLAFLLSCGDYTCFFWLSLSNCLYVGLNALIWVSVYVQLPALVLLLCYSGTNLHSYTPEDDPGKGSKHVALPPTTNKNECWHSNVDFGLFQNRCCVDWPLISLILRHTTGCIPWKFLTTKPRSDSENDSDEIS
jgi:hypothetical protein